MYFFPYFLLLHFSTLLQNFLKCLLRKTLIVSDLCFPKQSERATRPLLTKTTTPLPTITTVITTPPDTTLITNAIVENIYGEDVPTVEDTTRAPRNDVTSGSIECIEGMVPCSDGSRCIILSWICDRSVDCPDGSDEATGKCFHCRWLSLFAGLKFSDSNNR